MQAWGRWGLLQPLHLGTGVSMLPGLHRSHGTSPKAVLALGTGAEAEGRGRRRGERAALAGVRPQAAT